MWSVEFFDENAKSCKSQEQNIDEGSTEPSILNFIDNKAAR